MAIDFPLSPSTGDQFTAGATTYEYDGEKWISTGTSPNSRLVKGANTLEITSANDLVWSGDSVLLGTSTANTNDRLVVFDPGNAFMSIRSDVASDGNSQVLDFGVGTGDRSSSNLTAVIAADIHSTSGGTLKADLVFSTNGGDSISDRLRLDSDGDLLPQTNVTQNLGQNSLRWRNVYAQSFTFNDGGGRIDYNTTANTMEFIVGGNQVAEFTTGSFVPVSSADTIALGTTAKRWGATRVQSLDVNGATNTVMIEHTGGSGLNIKRNSKDLSFNANYSAADTHAAIELTTGMDLAFYLGGAERTRFESDGEVRFTGQVRITEERPHFRLICSAPTSNTDPRAIMNFECQNSNNDEDMYRINFWEGNSAGETANANQSIRYNGSPSDGGDGSIRFVQENGNVNFFVSRNGNGGIQGTLTQNTSDIRLKENITLIENALEKVSSLSGFTYTWNQEAKDAGLRGDEHECLQVGVSAQDVQKVQPEAVKPSPVNRQKYITVQYERLVPLLIEAIKELKEEVEELKRTK